MTSYLTGTGGTRSTPQRTRARADQVANSEGGFVWEITPFQRLQRFLILGSEGGSYYASQRELTDTNVEGLRLALTEDAARAIELIVNVSDKGRAKRNDEAIFALAYAAGSDDADTRALALEALPKVCRTATHLFQFVGFLKLHRGWGPALRRAISRWYSQDIEFVALQAVKYRERAGWSHRDVLRKAHVNGNALGLDYNRLFGYIVGGDFTVEELPPIIQTYERLRNETDVSKIAAILRETGAPRELVPTDALASPEVWDAMLPKMPLTATIRNLANMTRIGLLTPRSDATKLVLDKLESADLRKARVHPIALLLAEKTYAAGHGLRGTNSWTPLPQIVDVLDDAFYRAFDAVDSTNLNYLLAIDISGSMSWSDICGIPGFTPRVAAGAMAMLTVKTEKAYEVTVFSDSLRPVPLSPKQRLDDVLGLIDRMPAGGTDCALPMLWAIEEKRFDVDVFVVYTDSETWAGSVQPFQALKQYRERSGRNAKLIVVGLESNEFSIADPRDPGMLDCVGMDANTPVVMREFSLGNV